MTVQDEPHDQRFDPDQRAFVLAHREADPSALALRRAPASVDLRLAVDQIRAWQKLRLKAPAWADRDDLVLPGAISVEQASSPMTAAYKASLITQPTVVDLCGGLGMDTLAFAARSQVTRYVERDSDICRAFAWNAPRLGFPEVEICNGAAEAVAADLPLGCAVYLDPARREPNAATETSSTPRRVAAFADSSPDVTALLPILRQRQCTVLIKASPMLDLTAGATDLVGVSAIHVVSVDNVCRELLFLLDPRVPAVPLAEVPIICMAFDRGGRATRWEGNRAADAAVHSVFGPPERYVLDADVAVRKSGLFRQLALDFGLSKLAPNTHLFSSDQIPEAFPGRVFEVVADGVSDPRGLLPDRRAQVISRNHPLGADALRARYRLREGGDHVVIGYRDVADRPRLLVARRLPAPRGG